jgi:hypothetical protein
MEQEFENPLLSLGQAISIGGEYVRPDIGRQMLTELVPDSVRLLINPSWDALRSALSDLQRRCRRNRLSDSQLRTLFDAGNHPGFFSAVVKAAERAPRQYGHDFSSTQAAACWLGDGLVGFVLRRESTPPGESVSSPVYPLTPADGDDFDPQKYFESVCTTFWTRLTDGQIAGLEQWMLAEAMVKAAREEERLRIDAMERAERRLVAKEVRKEQEQRRAEERRRTMVALFRGVEPTFATHLADACRSIGGTLAGEGQEFVRWSDFKKRWPSLADKYSNDFLPLLEDGRVSACALRQIGGTHRDFTLGLGLWTGMQRLFPVPQVVFRVECQQLLQRLAGQGEGFKRVTRKITVFNERSKRSHPTEKWGVGWLRVHVDDGNQIVFVDEVQSDVLELLDAGKEPPLKEPSEQVMRALRPWNLHGFASVHRWANDIGYRVAIHGRQSCLLKPGMTRSERKWNLYYQPIIKQFGLKEETVPGYPAPIMVEAPSGILGRPGPREGIEPNNA